MGYPKLIIDTEAFRNNIRLIKNLCDKNNILLSAVVKVFHADEKLIDIMLEEGVSSFCSSRIVHLRSIKKRHRDSNTLLIRIPMIGELEDVVLYADSVLVSSKEIVDELNEVAKAHGKIQNVILMEDLGDLREGLTDQEEIVSLSCYIESLSNVNLYGIGTNLTCYGSIRPTVCNLSKLVNTKEMIEKKINRKLDIVSGGATTSVELLLDKTMPLGINHLRVGGLFTTPMYIKEFKDWGKYLPLKNVFSVEAEVIESNSKPTYPIGEIVVDGFGNKVEYTDRGIRKRIIIGLGRCDVGSYLQLYPHDKKSFILGGSSDHTIVDVHDSDISYKIGDKVLFDLDYESIMFGAQSRYFEVIYK